MHSCGLAATTIYLLQFITMHGQYNIKFINAQQGKDIVYLFYSSYRLVLKV